MPSVTKEKLETMSSVLRQVNWALTTNSGRKACSTPSAISWVISGSSPESKRLGDEAASGSAGSKPLVKSGKAVSPTSYWRSPSPS